MGSTIEKAMMLAPAWVGDLPTLIAERAGIPVEYVIPTLVVLVENCLLGPQGQRHVTATEPYLGLWVKSTTGTVPEPEPNTGTNSGNGAGTKERARAILAESPGISGSELGRQLGLSGRMGRKLKVELV